jgi:hypothetical protein
LKNEPRTSNILFIITCARQYNAFGHFGFDGSELGRALAVLVDTAFGVEVCVLDAFELFSERERLEKAENDTSGDKVSERVHVCV